MNEIGWGGGHGGYSVAVSQLRSTINLEVKEITSIVAILVVAILAMVRGCIRRTW